MNRINAPFKVNCLVSTLKGAFVLLFTFIHDFIHLKHIIWIYYSFVKISVNGGTTCFLRETTPSNSIVFI